MTYVPRSDGARNFVGTNPRLSQSIYHRVDTDLEPILNVKVPKAQDMPARLLERLVSESVTLARSGNFFIPVGAGLPRRKKVGMTVPETAVNEDGDTPTGERDIRSTWHVPNVASPTAYTFLEQRFPERDLWGRVLGADA
jgi:hypothetical protein